MLIKVKPWGKDQGDYVLIDESEFDPKTHKKIEEAEKPKKTKKAPEQESSEETNQE